MAAVAGETDAGPQALGIAALGRKLCGAPFHALMLLGVATLAGAVRGSSADAVHSGAVQWRGIAAPGRELSAHLVMPLRYLWLRPRQGRCAATAPTQSTE